MTRDRRFIEETFPVKEVSKHASKEKNIRHGHISTLHIWWARRPLAASRATAFAALVPPPKDTLDWQKQRDFIADLSKWENALSAYHLERARRAIYEAHAERLSAELGKPVTVEDIEAGRVPPPRVLDPFAGGGSYPLEALRLGCEAYANDYNPVAVLILKATLEYPQKYGRPFAGMPADLLEDDEAAPSDDGPRQMGLGLEDAPAADAVPADFNPLLAAVRKWGRWVLEEARKELAAFYPPAPEPTPAPQKELPPDRWHVPEALRRKMVAVAREFRKHPTPSESLLWQALRGKQLDGVKFRRQQPIGPFVVDFFAPSHRLIVEVDGPIHQTQKAADEERQRLLESLGLRVLRLSAEMVENDLPAALEAIREALHPHPRPLPHQGGGASTPLSPGGRGGQGGEGAATETVVGYIWARTLPCQNPSCGAEIPLMRQFWLAKKKDREIALHPVVRDGKVDFEIVARGKKANGPTGKPYAPWPAGFDPKQGTVRRAVVTCPVCGAVMDANTTRRLFREGHAGQRMVAVVVTRKGQRGKFYRLPTQEDLDAYAAAERALAEKRERLAREWGMDPVPTEPTPEGKGSGAERAFSVRNYGMATWGDLFNPRQQLALITFAEKVRQAHAAMLAQGYPEDFARAVATYLGFALNKLATHLCSLTRWRADALSFERAFDRQALPMVWDFGEVNPFSASRGQWDTGGILEVIEHLSLISHPKTLIPPAVSHASATRLPYPDNHFDAVLTDPPYYDNVPYSYLSDFFYVWLKRTVGHLYPDLFVTPLTPKGEEIVAYSHGQGGLEEGKRRFEAMLGQAFREIHRVLKPEGLAVIVYAYKTTAGWETVINALLESGLVVSAAWPLNTEMQSRLRANESAALASSIYIVARKMARQGVGFYPEVRAELRRAMDAKLQRLWEEGIGGADFFIAAIGAGIEVFGKYEKVMDYEGNLIRAEQLLEEVRELATDFAVHQILHNGFAGEVNDRTRFYVLWRWNYGEARVPFDEARKLAQSCSLDIAEEWRRKGSFVKKEKEFVRVLGPHQRAPDDLASSGELIDVLHHVLLLWEKGERPAMVRRLSESGYGTSEAFYRVAQAVSESLPLESKEKKLLDGLLTGRARLQQEVKQSRLL